MKKRTGWLIVSGLLLGLFTHAQPSPQAEIDSLRQIVERPASDLDLYYAYTYLASHYKSIDLGMALETVRTGTRTAKEKGDPYWTADFYHQTGNVLLDLGQLDSALYYFDLSSEMQKQAVEAGKENKEENDYLTLYLLRDVGRIHVLQGHFNRALELFLQGLALAERMDDPDELSFLYGQLADIYFRMSNHEQAEIYYLKMKELTSKTNNWLTFAEANLGLIPILNARGEYSKALEYGEEAYRLLLQEQSQTLSWTLANATMRLSETWIKIPDYDTAMKYAQASVDYARQTGNPSFLANALYTLSTVYLKLEKYADCEQTAFQALAVDSLNTSVNSILYGNIAQANIWMGNKKKGIEYFGKTLDANRAFSNTNFQASLSEMEVKYETEKKEMQIVDLKKEKELVTWLGLAGMAILLLVLVLFLALWRWAVQKKRVAEQLHQIAEQQVKQLEQEKQLIATQAVLDGETAERTRLARDLHDGLGSMLTGVKLNLESMKSNREEQKHFDNAMGMLNESMLELRRVAHHLMPDSLSRFGLKMALTDFCSNFSSIDFAYFGNEDRFDPQMEVMIYRIIHELVNNALKHADASQILVQVMKEEEYFAFIVRDNGCGFDTSSKTPGMGLRNIYARVASYGGRMEIDSKIDEGTEINIEFKMENGK